MPPAPRRADQQRIAQALADLFGGVWEPWNGGPGAGIGNATMWTQVKPNADGRAVLTGIVIIGDGITANGLRKIPVAIIEQKAAEVSAGNEARMRAEVAKLPPLARGQLTAAEFSQLVAAHYLARAPFMARPAAAIVQDTGEKSGTVHGWIREARLRGFLPEAKRGKRARG